MSVCSLRIVVRIEISTLSDTYGKLDHNKMDRLAMLIANLNNSGKEILVISSGAIALGCEKLGLKEQPVSYTDLQATAAIGQAELIKFYQRYFDEYNQIVAQVLLTSDIMENQDRVNKTLNTFNTLLKKNIIPIINENDAVSRSDIELDDNYPLAYNVARITNADIILVKTDRNSSYIIQPRGNRKAKLITSEHDLFEELETICNDADFMKKEDYIFPEKIEHMDIMAD
jgi:glutamate 5-kinase